MRALHAGALVFLFAAACGGDAVEGKEAALEADAPASEPAPEPEPEIEPDPAGTTELADGLEVTIVEGGRGPRAQLGDRVLVHYRAFVAGSEEPFDSSYARLVPDRLTLTTAGRQRALPGLVHGLIGQRAGTHARLEVPAALGWGSQGNESIGVPADADLTFEVHLVEVGE